MKNLNIPNGIRRIVEELNFTKIALGDSSAADELYQEFQARCDGLEEEVKVYLPTCEIRRLSENELTEKVTIRVFYGKKEGYEIFGVRSYARLDRPKKWFSLFLPKQYDSWSANENSQELIRISRIPSREEFSIRFCGLCGDMVTLTSGEMELSEYFYIF